MQPLLSPQSVEALVQVISGGSGNSITPPIGIYRSAPRIDAFMRACGVRMAIGSGSRVPTLAAAIEGVVARGETQTLRAIVEAAANPADFLDDPGKGDAVIDYLNQRLVFDQLAIRRRGTKVELVDSQSNAPVVGALSAALTPINFDTVTRDLERALTNADSDPEDSVTSACAVVESVCRSIIVELGVDMPAKRDIQTLFRTVRDHLGLDPKGEFKSEVAEDVRTTLGGLAACIHGIGSLRTHGGDAHGRERGHARYIDARIARLAIHSAGAAALFLIETWQFRHPTVELRDREPNLPQ